MVKTRLITSDGSVLEYAIEGNIPYSDFHRLLSEKTHSQSIISEQFLDDDLVDLPQSESLPSYTLSSTVQLRCSSWEPGLSVSSVRDKEYSPLLWFYNVVGNRLQTLKQYFKYGNLVSSNISYEITAILFRMRI